MHYKDGSPAKIGHRLRYPTQEPNDEGAYAPVTREGLVIDIQPGATTCNAQVAYPVLEKSSNGSAILVKLANTWVTLGECERCI